MGVEKASNVGKGDDALGPAADAGLEEGREVPRRHASVGQEKTEHGLPWRNAVLQTGAQGEQRLEAIRLLPGHGNVQRHELRVRIGKGTGPLERAHLRTARWDPADSLRAVLALHPVEKDIPGL